MSTKSSTSTPTELPIINDFLTGYTVPEKTGRYLKKFDEGTTTIRFLEPPIMGWIERKFDDAKDGKFTMLSEDFWLWKDQKKQPTPKAKHFWACIIYNHTTQSIQYFELDKAQLIKEIVNLAQLGWDLLNVDLNIKREGTKKENTKYSINASPRPLPIPDDVLVEYHEVVDNLENVFHGGDPFMPLTQDQKNEVQEDKATARIVNDLPEIDINSVNIQMPF